MSEHRRTRMPTAFGGGWRALHDGGYNDHNDHPGTSCHPSAEGNFSPRRYVPSSPPLEGWAQPGVVREFKKTHLLPILCHSRAGGNDRGESARANAHRLWRGVSCFARRGVGRVEGSHLSAYSPLSSRAKRGDPVNKKALRAYRPQTTSTL